jgi:hypothetical protein
LTKGALGGSGEKWASGYRTKWNATLLSDENDESVMEMQILCLCVGLGRLLDIGISNRKPLRSVG